jgi:hypothetical protein
MNSSPVVSESLKLATRGCEQDVCPNRKAWKRQGRPDLNVETRQVHQGRRRVMPQECGYEKMRQPMFSKRLQASETLLQR